MSNFFEELKRRKVYRTAVAYAAVSFVIMQIVEIIFPMFEIPLWMGRFVIILIVLGFPVAMILSWMFDKSADGITRDKGQSSSNFSSTKPFYLQKQNIFIIAVLLVGIIIGRFASSTNEKKSLVNPKSVAVLPFDNYSTAPEDQYFSDGMTEVIIANLAKIKDLKVISRTSVMEYKKTTKNIKEIASELGVAHILEGSIQRANGRIRVIGQLIDTKSDEHIWAETYDREESDIFALQSDVALKIAKALKSNITAEQEERINERLTESTDAYEYYLKGKDFENAGSTKENIEAAIGEYERAVILDPNFAEAYALIGVNHLGMKWYGYDLSNDRITLAKKSIDKALELKPNNATVRYGLGIYHYHGFRNYAEAMKEFRYALSIEPGSALFNIFGGAIYRRLGDYEKAEKSMLLAYELDPRSTFMLMNLKGTVASNRKYKQSLSIGDKSMNKDQLSSAWNGRAYYFMTGDANTAIQMINKDDFIKMELSLYINDFIAAKNFLNNIKTELIQNNTVFMPKNYYLGIIEQGLGQKELGIKYLTNALDQLKKYIIKYPTDPRPFSSLGFVYARLGNKDEAIKAGLKATELLPVSKDAMFGTYHRIFLTQIYALVNDKEKALEGIEYLSTIPAGLHYGELKSDHIWDSLREESRFKYVISKLAENPDIE